MLIKISKFFNVTTDYLLGLKDTTTINVDGLTSSEIVHIKLLVDDLRSKNK